MRRLLLATLAIAALMPVQPAMAAPSHWRQESVASDYAAAALVERYRIWRGGAAFEAMTAARYQGEVVTGDMRGLTSMLMTADGDMVTSTDFGVIKSGRARRGSSGWALTPAGQVEELAPDVARDLEREATLGFDRLLRNPERLRRLPDAELDARTWAVAAIDFGDNDRRELYLDPGTGALHAIRIVRDRRETLTRLSEWRSVAGVRMPHRVETSGDAGTPDSTVIWSKIEVNPTVTEADFTRPVVRTRYRIANGAHTTGFMPFDLFAGTRIYIPAEVNGATTEVLLDSGAEMTVLSTSFARQLGLKTEGQVAAVGTGGVGQAQFAKGVTISLGDITFEDMTVAVIDLDGIGQQIGRALPVVLGKDAFNAFVIDVDFPGKRIAFHEADMFEAPEGMVEQPLTSTGSIRAVPMSIEGRPPALFDFDTGNGGTLIVYPAYAEANGLLDRPRSTVMSGAVGGMRESAIMTVARVSIGGMDLNNVPAVVPPPGPSAVDSDRVAGNVGLGILARFRMVTDFKRGKVYLSAPAETLAQPFPKDRLGLSLRKTPDAIVVQRVSPNSPAAAAGWQAGELIIAIDGRPHHQLGPQDLRAVITGAAGRTVTLTLADGSTRQLQARDFY